MSDPSVIAAAGGEPTQSMEVSPADFAARVVAFTFDLSLAVEGYFITLKLGFPEYSPFLNPHARACAIVWLALFLLYQTYFSCGGRRSAGKALLGLRVIDLSGEPLTFSKAAIRSLCYVPSSILNLGFLWALLNPERRGWHDLAAGSLVIEDNARAPLGRFFVRVGAVACVALLALAWYWNNIASVRYRRLMDAAYAQTGVDKLKELENLHFSNTGRYAENIADLASLTGAPDVFLEDIKILLASVKITATPNSYKIVAQANNDVKTEITYNGP